MTIGIATKVDANQIRVGDFIPGLDNAYVIEVEEQECASFETHGYHPLLGTFIVVTYNDAEGDEGYLLLTPGTKVAVTPEDGSDPSLRPSSLDEDDDWDEED